MEINVHAWHEVKLHTETLKQPKYLIYPYILLSIKVSYRWSIELALQIASKYVLSLE